VFHEIKGEGGQDAVWTSKVMDAGLPAEFGMMQWRSSGSVEVESAPARGTRFTVRLPTAGTDGFTSHLRSANEQLTEARNDATADFDQEVRT
jgi:hypothetical protein